MKAYHSDPKQKSSILKQLRSHARADELVQGYGYWKDGKGCAVGCTLHSGDHAEYEPRFGIPQVLARLEDDIFEGLSITLARKWPVRFMSAIEPGSDLSLAHWKLLHWLLTDETVNPGINHTLVKESVKSCADLMRDLSKGKKVSQSTAWAAAESAWAAAQSAQSAARSAQAAAQSAAWAAVESAAWAARSALRSAAHSAAESAWVKISNKLIELIKESKP